MTDRLHHIGSGRGSSGDRRAGRRTRSTVRVRYQHNVMHDNQLKTYGLVRRNVTVGANDTLEVRCGDEGRESDESDRELENHCQLLVLRLG